MPQNNTSRSRERGNVFIFILLGVVLFAALSYTVARGMRGDTASSMSEKQEKIIFQEVVSYTQKLSRAVDRVRRKGCSENEISFERAPFNGSDAAYVNGNSPGDFSCHIFNPAGGNVEEQDLSQNHSALSLSSISGANSVNNIGQTCANASCSELVYFLEVSNDTFCMNFNDYVNVTNLASAPPTHINANTATTFQGTFSLSTNIGNEANSANLTGKHTACFLESSSSRYGIYSVLLER